MRYSLLALAVAAGISATPALASINLVQNGDFEQASSDAGGQIGYNGFTVDHWTTSGYNFLFPSGSADSTGVTGQYGNLQLWGPSNGVNNGLPASSPTGGNFVGLDGAFQVSPLSQTVNGLVAGHEYNVSFYWAGAQQSGFDGPNTEQFEVSLGNQSFYTDVYHNPSHGFSGWMTQTFAFTATGPSEVLSFLAIGTPPGVPPFSLLDGVSLEAAAPEPATWAMMALGFAGLGFAGYRSNRRKAAVAI